MLSEDYIMRLINQALAVFMAALGLKRRGKYQEALEVFDQAVESLLGLRARLVYELDDQILLERLTVNGKLDVERLQLLADIFREEAELFELQGHADKSAFYIRRSLRLYLEVALAGDTGLSSEVIHQIEAQRIRVNAASLPIETRLALQDYLERLLASSDDVLTTNGLSRSTLQADFSFLEKLDPITPA